MSNPEVPDTPPARQCSFCDKDETAVRKLIAGHSAFICNECVELCLSVVNAPVSEDSMERDLTRVWAGLASQGKWTAALLAGVLSQMANEDEPDPHAESRNAMMAGLVLNQIRHPRRPVSAGQIRCGFCAKTTDETQSMTAGHGGFICNECVELALESRAWGDRSYRETMIQRLTDLADRPLPPPLSPI